MIQVDHVSIHYPDGENNYLAVNNVSLAFKPGSFTSIIGRSGSGKTSLLNAMGGLLKPSAGKILADGEDIYNYSGRRLAEYRSSHIGYIFQNFYLEDQYSVEQNIEIALMISGCPAASRREKIAHLLATVGMDGMQKKRAGKLSGGERQRVCIARALANDPEILLADEPCGNLDSHNGAVVMQFLREFAKNGKTVILVTHNKEDAGNTDRIIELRDGMVVSDETATMH